jgi:DNA processing protein
MGIIGLSPVAHPGWMLKTEMRARITWGLIANPGDRYAWGLINREGPEGALERVQRSSLSELRHHFATHADGETPSSAHLTAWLAPDVSRQVEHSAKLQEQRDVWVLTPDSALWPSGLLDLGPYQPHTLWLSGDSTVLTRGSSWLAVVGSRTASPWGLRATRAVVASDLVQGRGIISGGAVGIDCAAHQAALEHNRPQVAVLAGGLDALYPRAHHALFEDIRNAGILLSEAPCTIRSEGHRFLHRNRLIAALSSAVVVVEAGWRSGAMNTASHAAALGRGLGVVPGRWEDAKSAGCFRVVRERGAIVLSEPDDVGLVFARPA